MIKETTMAVVEAAKPSRRRPSLFLCEQFYDVIKNNEKKYWTIEEFANYCKRKSLLGEKDWHPLTNDERNFIYCHIGRDFNQIKKTNDRDSEGKLVTLYYVIQ